jgi:hypothetical protein
MGQQLQIWRSESGDRLWLSMLIDAMEEVSRTESRAVPCDPFVLAALRAQLARPAPSFAHCRSAFSLRH